jgi:hypothetical protein
METRLLARGWALVSDQSTTESEARQPVYLPPWLAILKKSKWDKSSKWDKISKWDKLSEWDKKSKWDKIVLNP